MAAIGALTHSDEMSHPAFEIVSERCVPEVGGRVTRLTHLATGCDVICVANQDPNKVMAITFPTLPSNSMGTAHVLEHMVFRGSHRYPVEQPFSLLLRGSMQTHLNATTQADRTSYFVASTHGTDFSNLTDVCLDALLHPLLTEAAFDEEAWHVTRTPEGRLAFGGIVLNEMRGHAAAPGAVLTEETRRALFPDSVYRHTFGGVAEEIPRLTVKAVRAFHRRFYQPGKALIFLWGDDDFGDRLAQIDRHFAGAGCRAVSGRAVRGQAAFNQPKVLRRPFAGGGAPLANRAWALSHSADTEVRLERSIMARILTGRASASLTQMLRDMDAHPVFGSFSQDDRHPILTIGYGVFGANRPDPTVTMQARLERIESMGIDPQIIRQTLDELEFELTENDSTPIPQGLAMFRRCIGAWRHGADPANVLGWHGPFARLRERYLRDPMALSRRICADLLHNPHRVDVTLVPDPDLVELRAREQAAVLARYALQRTPTEHQATQNRNPKFDPSMPVAHVAMPKLARGDLPSKVEQDQIVQGSLGTAQGLAVTIPDSGIVYLDIGLDIDRLPDDLLILVPLYERLMLEKAQASGPLAARIGQETGGITTQHWSAGGVPPNPGAARVFLRGKAKSEDLPRLGRIMAEMLTGAAEFDPGAVQRAIQSEISRQSTRLLTSGHLIADLRVRAGLHHAGTVAEMLDGIGQLAALRRHFQRPPEAIAAELRILHRRLLTSARPVVALGSSDPDRIALLAGLPDQIGLAGEGGTPPCAALLPETEAAGFPVGSVVNTVGLAGNLYSAGHARTGATAALARALQTGLLWDCVRVAGGAYGALCRHDADTGAISFISARDPHILRTIDVFRSAPDWLRKHVDRDMIEQCVAGAVGEATRPVLAGQTTLVCVQRHLQGIMHAHRQTERDELLSTARADALTAADAIEKSFYEERLVVLGTLPGLSAALRERPGLFSLQAAP